jgi:predicted transcriptional regulator
MIEKNPRLKGGFGMISKAVVSDPTIMMREKALYAYLVTYANSITNELSVSVNRMSAELGVTQATIKRSLRILEDKEIIRRISVGHKNVRKTILLK